MQFIVTDNEGEALALENNLIKQHRPKYNVLLRDDKTYPYIKLTTDEPYPRALITRRVRKDGASYFGPFFSGWPGAQDPAPGGAVFPRSETARSGSTARDRGLACSITSTGVWDRASTG